MHFEESSKGKESMGFEWEIQFLGCEKDLFFLILEWRV